MTGKKKKGNVFTILVVAFLAIYIVMLLVPYLWGFLGSLKKWGEFRDNPLGFPKVWTFANYQKVYSAFTVPYRNTETGADLIFGFPEMLFYSFAYSAVVALVSTLTVYIVAYARNRFDFKDLKALDYIVLFTMVVPIVGSLPSEIQLMTKLGLYENFFGMTVVAKMCFLSMYYFVIGAAIKAIPQAFTEAAEIDGANEFQVLVRVMAPLTLPIIATIFLIRFVETWNDYQTPYIYLKNYPTLAYGLYYAKYQSSTGIDRPTEQIAASFLVMLPAFALFLIFSDRFMNGISLGEGIKE